MFIIKNHDIRLGHNFVRQLLVNSLITTLFRKSYNNLANSTISHEVLQLQWVISKYSMGFHIQSKSIAVLYYYLSANIPFLWKHNFGDMTDRTSKVV